MLKIIATLGSIQVFVILANLIRSKIMAVLLGPAGIGVISVVDQGVYFLAQVSALSIPFATVKFLSRAQSQGRDDFERTYAMLFRILLGLTCLGALLGLVITFIQPEWLGAAMASYRALLVPAFLSMPAMTLHGFFSSVLAAAQKPRTAGLFGFVIAVALALSTLIGILWSGAVGLYWANCLASYLIVLGMIVYLRENLGLAFWHSRLDFLGEIRAHPDTLTFPLILYATSLTGGFSLLVARLSILASFGEAPAGLLQTAIGLAGALTLMLNPANALYLTPTVNRRIAAEEKIRAALEFQSRLVLASALLAMPIALFPDWLIIILYAPAFMAVASVVFIFVLGQCLAQLVGVYQALLIGLDDLLVYGASVIAGHLTLALMAWLLAPALGIWGVALALLGSGILSALLTFTRLTFKYRLALPARLKFLIVYSLLAVVGAGGLANWVGSADLAALASKAGVYLLFAASLFFLMSKQDQARFWNKLGALVLQIRQSL